MPAHRIHPDRPLTHLERAHRWKADHLKKNRHLVQVMWSLDLAHEAKAEAALHGVSVSQLLAAALLLAQEHMDEMPKRIADMQARFYPERLEGFTRQRHPSKRGRAA
jgi:hypothetical protein